MTENIVVSCSRVRHNKYNIQSSILYYIKYSTLWTALLYGYFDHGQYSLKEITVYPIVLLVMSVVLFYIGIGTLFKCYVVQRHFD